MGGSLISVPIETTFDFGAPNGEATFVNVQPVIPFRWGDWNVINRTIIPLIDAPGALVGYPGLGNPIKGDGATGLGDINHSVFFSPAKAGDFIWRLGPSISFPTATDAILGTEKWSLGPTAVILTQPKPWSLGVLARNIWSVGGASRPTTTYTSQRGRLTCRPEISGRRICRSTGTARQTHHYATGE